MRRGYSPEFDPPIQGEAGGRGLGLVDLDFGHSTTCPVVLGQMEVWLNPLCSWVTYWNI